MGNREDLLAAARECLYGKGYARTTARDIATAAGVSLAAIGYHYGSKEALLNQALRAAIREWGDDLARVLATGDDAALAPADRFAAMWTRVVESFARTRPLWTVQFELLAHIERTPELRREFADANRDARLGLAALLGYGPGHDEHELVAIGALCQAILAGLAAQWLVDPHGTPSGQDLLDAMRAVVDATSSTSAPSRR